MSPIAFHPAAANAFNAKILAISAGIVRKGPQVKPKPEFVPDVRIAHQLTGADLAGPVSKSTVGIDGKTTSHSFFKDGHEYTLEGEGFDAYLQLIDAVYRSGEIRNVLSKSYIEARGLEWIEQAHGATSSISPLTDFLSTCATGDVAAQTVWHPISGLHVEYSFPLSRSEIRPISRQQIDRWMANALTGDVDDAPAMREALSAKFRRFQGLAAVVTAVTAEATRATEIAREQAELLCALFALLSPALIRLNIASPTRPFGAEYIETRASLVESGGSLRSLSLAVRSPWSMEALTLSGNAIEAISRELFVPAAPLLVTSPTRFCSEVLDALLIYTRAAFTADTVEKLLYVLSALESLLLKSDNEPIQQNIGERLAFYLAGSKEERKRIPKLVRSTYSLRSGFLHHGRTFSEQDTVVRFFILARSFWQKLLSQLAEHESKAALIEHMDDLKFS